jgi:hypothetical protein
MKPQHASITRVRRCPCCQSTYSKKNAGTSKHGNTAARQQAKQAIKRAVQDN